jgi:hypothetical protein
MSTLQEVDPVTDDSEEFSFIPINDKTVVLNNTN